MEIDILLKKNYWIVWQSRERKENEIDNIF